MRTQSTISSLVWPGELKTASCWVCRQKLSPTDPKGAGGVGNVQYTLPSKAKIKSAAVQASDAVR